MTYLGDTLTVGLVLILLFGSIALYLYTRIQQAEQKISLLESILLELKMASEVQTYTELPADPYSPHRSKSPTQTPSSPSSSQPTSTYQPFDDSHNDSTESSHVVTLEPISELESSDVQSSQDSSSDLFTPMDSVPFEPVNDVNEQNEVDQYKSVIEEAVNETSSKSTVQYENLTLKELQTLAKTRGISGSAGKNKSGLVEALKALDRSTTVKPGSLSSGSFLETSVSVSNELA